MSFYDDASLIFDANAAAGKDGKAYNVKPVEELSSTEVVINGDFSIDGPGADGELGTAYGNYGWNTVTPSVNTQEGTTTISNGVLKLTNASGETDSRAYATDGVSSRNVITTNTYYKLVYTIVENNGCTSFKIYNAGGVQEDAPSSVGTHTVTLRNTSNQLFLFFNKTESSSISIDNVSIREITNQAADFTFTRGTNLTATRVGKDGYIEKGRENLLTYSNQFDTTWANSATIEVGGESGYDGSSDAWRIDKTAASGFISQASSQSGVLTASVYMKAGTLNWASIQISGVNNVRTFYDLQNNALGTSQSSVIDANIEDVGGGWRRCSITWNGLTGNVRIFPADADNNTSGTSGSIYIQDAQLEQGLVATDYIETGATTATAGLLEDEPRFDYTGGGCPALLMEPNRTNLVEYSEYFDVYNKGNATVTDNDSTSPEGVDNAASLAGDGVLAAHFIYKIYGSATAGTSYTFSFFAKKGSLNYVQLVAGSGAFGVLHQNYDLLNGVLGSSSGSVDSFIEDYGNGWWRVGTTITATASDVIAPFIALANSSTMLRLASFATSSDVKIYGLQVEAGSYPTSYIPTYGSSATRDGDGSADISDSMLTGGYDLSSSWSLFVDANSLKKTFYSSVRFLGLHTSGDYNIQLYVNTSGSDLGVNPYLQNNGDYVFGSSSNAAGSEDGFKICLTYDAGTNKISYYINGSLYNSTTSALTFGDETYGYIVGPSYTPTATDVSVGLKQILFAPTAFSNNDSEILTGTSYSSFASMASTLSYTQYE